MGTTWEARGRLGPRGNRKGTKWEQGWNRVRNMWDSCGSHWDVFFVANAPQSSLYCWRRVSTSHTRRPPVFLFILDTATHTTTVWEPCGNHVGAMEEPCRDNVVTMWEACENHVGSHVATKLGPCGNHVGIVREPCGNHVGTM